MPFQFTTLIYSPLIIDASEQMAASMTTTPFFAVPRSTLDVQYPTS